jgi:hypothetical protein
MAEEALRDAEPDTGCRSEIPQVGDRKRIGWTCNGDPEQLIEVGRHTIAHPDGRSRRVPIVVPRDIFASLPPDDGIRRWYSYAVPFGGERDHAHLCVGPSGPPSRAVGSEDATPAP